jgi:hypothetical protein
VASDENLTSFRPRVWWAVVESNERFSVQSSTNQPTNQQVIRCWTRKETNTTRRRPFRAANETRVSRPNQLYPISRKSTTTHTHSFIHSSASSPPSPLGVVGSSPCPLIYAASPSFRVLPNPSKKAAQSTSIITNPTIQAS